MTAHRFFGEGKIESFRRPPAPEIWAEGFVVCPLPLRPQQGDSAGWAHDLYVLAYQQAKASVAPPWHERSLLACPN